MLAPTHVNAPAPPPCEHERACRSLLALLASTTMTMNLCAWTVTPVATQARRRTRITRPTKQLDLQEDLCEAHLLRSSTAVKLPSSTRATRLPRTRRATKKTAVPLAVTRLSQWLRGELKSMPQALTSAQVSAIVAGMSGPKPVDVDTLSSTVLGLPIRRRRLPPWWSHRRRRRS